MGGANVPIGIMVAIPIAEFKPPEQNMPPPSAAKIKWPTISGTAFGPGKSARPRTGAPRSGGGRETVLLFEEGEDVRRGLLGGRADAPQGAGGRVANEQVSILQ